MNLKATTGELMRSNKLSIQTTGTRGSSMSMLSVLRRGNYKKFLKTVKFYIFGSEYEAYSKPNVSIKAFLIIIMNLHMSLRFFCNYIDLTLTWGGAFVFIVFTFVNVVIGSTLAGLYSFLGMAGNRTFLNFWDMMPFFQGISYSLILLEILIIAEKVLITTHAAEEVFSKFEHLRDFDNQEPVVCNNSRYEFIPGTGMQIFAYNNIDTRIFTNFRTENSRLVLVTAILLMVLVLRIIQFKYYRYFAIVITVIFYGIFIIATVVTIFISHEPAKVLIFPPFTEHSHYIEGLTQIIIFAIGDYLPCHLITIGFIMEDDRTILTKIWLSVTIKCFIAFCLLFMIPTIAGDFRDLIRLDRDDCLQISGVYFLFAMLPKVIRSYLHWEVSVRIIYFFSTLFYGVCNVLIRMDLFNFAISNQKMFYFRYRNIVFLVVWIICSSFTAVFTVHGFPYFFYFINFRCYFYVRFLIMAMTTLAIAIYNLERINGDYRFIYSASFRLVNLTKVHFMFYFVVFVTVVLNLLTEEEPRPQDHHVSYTIIITLCLIPLSYGVFTCSQIKSKYHGLCIPSPTWGSLHTAVRTQRRSKANRTMYTYRMKGQCAHNCLIGHPALKRKIEKDKEIQDTIKRWYNFISTDSVESL